jgi:TolB-like protein
MGRIEMRRKRIAIFLTILGLLLPGVILSPICAAEGPKRVAILPFSMNADRDLTFLQEGIMDMLASRLAWKGEVQVLEKGQVKRQVAQSGGPVDRAKALDVGRALQADYVIFGSLTVFGESVSLDARILDVPKEEELMTAFKQTKGMDEVIPTVNQFAMDINEKIMGRSVAPAAAVAASVPETPKGPGGLAAVGEDFEGKGVEKVQGFKVQIVSLDIGDVDGDGKNELVLADKSKVYIYKWEKNGFALFKTIKGGMSAEYVNVSLGDLDRNGRAEIYVSSLASNGVSSPVFEWDGNGFREIVKGQRWLLRVIDFPGQGQTLVGQRRAVGGRYTGKVQFLKREGDGLASTGPLDLPSQANVFNFAVADLQGNGVKNTVLLDSSDHLRLYNPAKDVIWTSDEYYGGSITYIETELDKNWYFIPVPIYITDVNGDGKKEVMICQNNAKTGRFIRRFRYYSSGALHFLTGDSAGLSVKWTTRKAGGPITGYRVADVDHDGSQELVVAAVTKEAKMLVEPRSQVVVYDLK